MSPLILLGLLVCIPLLLGMVLRVHTSALFLSIGSGYLLATFVGDTASLVARSFITSESTGTVAQLVLFLLPIAITMWLMRGSLAPAQVVLHFLPLLGCAVLIMVLGLQFFTEATRASVYSDPIGSYVQQMPDALVGLAVAFQLILMWITARPRRHAEAHHKRGHHKE